MFYDAESQAEPVMPIVEPEEETPELDTSISSDEPVPESQPEQSV